MQNNITEIEISNTLILKYQKLVSHEFAQMKAIPQVAGFDLKSLEDYTILPRGVK